jgi:hypothetical protein
MLVLNTDFLKRLAATLAFSFSGFEENSSGMRGWPQIVHPSGCFSSAF